jgi:hypothetical protein
MSSKPERSSSPAASRATRASARSPVAKIQIRGFGSLAYLTHHERYVRSQAAFRSPPDSALSMGKDVLHHPPRAMPAEEDDRKARGKRIEEPRVCRPVDEAMEPFSAGKVRAGAEAVQARFSRSPRSTLLSCPVAANRALRARSPRMASPGRGAHHGRGRAPEARVAYGATPGRLIRHGR